MISLQCLWAFDDISKISFFVLFQPLLVIWVIPSSSHWSLQSDTLLVLGILQTLINLLEFFFCCKERLACGRFQFCDITLIDSSLLSQNKVLFSRINISLRESLDYSWPLLTDCHFMLFQWHIGHLPPGHQNSDCQLCASKLHELGSKNDQSVFLVGWNSWDETENEIEYSRI